MKNIDNNSQKLWRNAPNKKNFTQNCRCNDTNLQKNAFSTDALGSADYPNIYYYMTSKSVY